MYEINTATLILLGIDDNNTKILGVEEELIVNESAKSIINNACGYFGSNLVECSKKTTRITGFKTKVPIVIEETRNIMFFPLKSTRDVNNVWISFNNLEKYIKSGNKTILFFKGGKSIEVNFSYYMVDNQVTRCMMLDYINNQKRKSL